VGPALGSTPRSLVNREIADVLPPAALLQILRGLAIGLVLTDAVPRRVRRAAPEPAAPERQVLLDALAALVRETRKPDPAAQK
jgi:hypothetical protein